MIKSRKTPRPKNPTVLTPADIAELRDVGIDRVLSWIHSGELKAANVAAHLGGRPRWQINPEDLENFIRRRSLMTPLPRTRWRRKKRTEGTIEFFKS
jgi:hypothetical protein